MNLGVGRCPSRGSIIARRTWTRSHLAANMMCEFICRKTRRDAAARDKRNPLTEPKLYSVILIEWRRIKTRIKVPNTRPAVKERRRGRWPLHEAAAVSNKSIRHECPFNMKKNLQMMSEEQRR